MNIFRAISQWWADRRVRRVAKRGRKLLEKELGGKEAADKWLSETLEKGWKEIKKKHFK